MDISKVFDLSMYRRTGVNQHEKEKGEAGLRLKAEAFKSQGSGKYPMGDSDFNP